MTTASAEELKGQGNKAFGSGKFQEAIDLFTQAIALDSNNHVLFSNRSAAYSSLKDYENALQDAEKCLAIKPDWSKGYGRKGAALFGLQRFDEAEKTYTQGLKLEPSNSSLKQGLEDVKASLMGQRGNPLAGLFSGDVLAKIAGNPQLSPFLASPDYVQKVQQLQQNPALLTEYMQDPRIMQTMGALLGINIMTPDQAMPKEGPSASFPSSQSEPAQEPPADDVKMEEAAPVEPEPVEPELTEEEKELADKKEQSKKEKESGNAAYKAKNFPVALEHYGKAWELNDEDITILTNKAAVYFEQGEYDLCIKTCEEAVDRGRELRADFKLIAKAFARIGNAYTKKDDLENAIKFYQKSLTENRIPDTLNRLRDAEKLKEQRDREAYQNPQLADEARNKGNELFKEGKYPEAIPFYTEAIKRAEKDPRGYSNRSACYTKLMAMSDAMRDAEKAIDLDKTFVKGYIRKAAVQFGMKEYAKCMQTCEQAMEIDAEHHQGKNRAEIEGQIQKAQYAMYGDRTSGSEEERMKNAMKDPKVQEILADPIMRQILDQMSKDPAAAQDHLRNPDVREKVQYLAAAGVIGLR